VKQLDNQGLFVFSSHWLLLTSLTLSFCSYIDDSGLGYLTHFKKLNPLRLNSTPNITSRGLLVVAVGCNSLSILQLINCQIIGSNGWLEYLGSDGSLEELIVEDCEGISQDDLLKFGLGWMKLQKFVFETNNRCSNAYLDYDGYDPSYEAHSSNMYDICCESLKDLSLACINIATGEGLRFLLGRCKALEKLCLKYVWGLNDNDMIALYQSCNNLKSISLCYSGSCWATFTDNSLKALTLSCPMLQNVELTFADYDPEYPSETGFTQKGLVVLIQSCPIRVLVLKGAHFFDIEGMEAVSSAPYRETLKLVNCKAVTDARIAFHRTYSMLD
jgi:F-box/leucine-rich repeat protein 2/20